MAAYTVSEIPDAFFAMFAFDLGLIVLVATVTGITEQTAWVAGLAGIAPAAVVGGEAVSFIVSGWQPGVSIVTGAAVSRE